MAAQWTKSNPGAGDMASLASFQSTLAQDEIRIEDSLSVLSGVRSALDTAWRGGARAAFDFTLERAITDLQTFDDAIRTVKTALRRYEEAVVAIQHEARKHSEIERAAGLVLARTYADSTTSPPSDSELRKRRDSYNDARADHATAIKKLGQLAEERLHADNDLIGVLRERTSRITPIDVEELKSLDRGFPYDADYSYEYSHPVANASEISAKEVMNVFKANPSKIFPFEIEGATAFEDGDTIRLVNAAPSLDSTGDVRVSTTDTSVTFTVVSDEYFDGPGSTITFRAEERKGIIYFEQQANAYDANVFVSTGVDFGAALIASWDQQAQHLRNLLPTTNSESNK